MEYYSIQKACDMAGVTNTLMKRLIREERISLRNGKIPEDVVCKIADENKKYVCLREYSFLHENEQFHGSIAHDRNNLLDVLEENEFFGIEISEPKDLLIGSVKDILFFQRSEMPFLDSKLKDFSRIWTYRKTKDTQSIEKYKEYWYCKTFKKVSFRSIL